MLVLNSLIGIVSQYNDLIDLWDIFRKIFNVRDQQQSILLTNKLNEILMKEGGGISIYLTKATNIKNQLEALNKTIVDKKLIKIVFNC